MCVFAIGLDALTQEAPGGDLTHAYSQFPEVPQASLERPEGPIDILLGQDYAGYLPRVEKSKGHLLLLKSDFGTGRLLSGRTGVEGTAVCEHVLTAQATEYGRGTRILPPHAALVNFVGR